MRNFRLTHIAVNLSLIVAMMVQPVAVCFASAGGVSSCTNSQHDSFTCPGCGCCEVETASDRCCCCAGSAKTEPNAPVKSSCCSSKHESETADVEATTDTKPSKSVITPAKSGVKSICLCEQRSQPLPDPSPRRTSSDSRDIISLDVLDFDQNAWDGNASSLVSKHCACTAFSPHYSQIVLCIWRL